jgi:ATP-dependent Lon protease
MALSPPETTSANAVSSSYLSDRVSTALHHHTYIREAGVRALERAIGGVARFKAIEWAAHEMRGDYHHPHRHPLSPLPSSHTVADNAADGLDKGARLDDAGYDPDVDAGELEKILGLPQLDCEDRDCDARRGVVWGLVVTGMGEGELMPVESIATPGNGNLKLTGSLGDVRSLTL